MKRDFWEMILEGYNSSSPSSVDQHIGHRTPRSKRASSSFESVRGLTDGFRAGNALKLPVAKGTKVMFKGAMGSYLSYEDPPEDGEIGEVVAVKSAGSEITSHEGLVFVKWSSGKFLGVHAEFLKSAEGGDSGSERVASPRGKEIRYASIKVSSLGDLTEFLKVAEDTLVHKSTKDLWKYSKDADGNFLVERLFNSKGEPIKG